MSGVVDIDLLPHLQLREQLPAISAPAEDAHGVELFGIKVAQAGGIGDRELALATHRRAGRRRIGLDTVDARSAGSRHDAPGGRGKLGQATTGRVHLVRSAADPVCAAGHRGVDPAMGSGTRVP